MTPCDLAVLHCRQGPWVRPGTFPSCLPGGSAPVIHSASLLTPWLAGRGWSSGWLVLTPQQRNLSSLISKMPREEGKTWAAPVSHPMETGTRCWIEQGPCWGTSVPEHPQAVVTFGSHLTNVLRPNDFGINSWLDASVQCNEGGAFSSLRPPRKIIWD